jgi:predicted RNA-binding protein YlxR (DUF448 family)
MQRFPLRTCIGCRTVCAASELVCLIAPEGRVRVARRGRGQAAADERDAKRGRGVWVHSRCLAGVLAKGVLGRAFRRPVAISDQETLLACVHSARGRFIDGQGNSR